MVVWARRSNVMLAYPFEEKRLNKWQSPWLVQPKLDGERCRAEIDPEGNVKLISSEMNEFNQVPHINENLKRLGYRDIELDGELYIHEASLEDIHSIVSRRKNIHDDYYIMQYHVFDIISTGAQIERIDRLLDMEENEVIIHVPSYVVESKDEIYEYLQDFYSDGYEGIIVRELFSPYVRRRSTSMMKWKPRAKDTYLIVDTKEEVDKDGRRKGTLGSVGFTGADGSIGWVGTGYSQLERAELWRIRDTLPGKFVEVEYQHLTSKRGVPKHSSFVRILDGPEGDEIW